MKKYEVLALATAVFTLALSACAPAPAPNPLPVGASAVPPGDTVTLQTADVDPATGVFSQMTFRTFVGDGGAGSTFDAVASATMVDAAFTLGTGPEWLTDLVRASDPTSSRRIEVTPNPGGDSTIAVVDGSSVISSWSSPLGGATNKVSRIEFSPDGVYVLVANAQIAGALGASEAPYEVREASSGLLVSTFVVVTQSGETIHTLPRWSRSSDRLFWTVSLSGSSPVNVVGSAFATGGAAPSPVLPFPSCSPKSWSAGDRVASVCDVGSGTSVFVTDPDGSDAIEISGTSSPSFVGQTDLVTGVQPTNNGQIRTSLLNGITGSPVGYLTSPHNGNEPYAPVDDRLFDS